MRFSCKEKYELKGNKTQSCVGLDLSNIIVSCVKGMRHYSKLMKYDTSLCDVAVCPQLYNPENGNVTVNEDRTFAKYKCQIGFSLRGSEMRECDDGAWTGTEAECVFGMQYFMLFMQCTYLHTYSYIHGQISMAIRSTWSVYRVDHSWRKCETYWCQPKYGTRCWGI